MMQLGWAAIIHSMQAAWQDGSSLHVGLAAQCAVAVWPQRQLPSLYPELRCQERTPSACQT